mgnify:CR=1 FL=1
MLLILFLICSLLIILMYKNKFTLSEKFQNIEYHTPPYSNENDFKKNTISKKISIYEPLTLEDKYYHTHKKDCIFDTSCQLPPNNVNFFKIKQTKKVIPKKICSRTSKKISNCSSISGNCLQKRQFECSGIPKEKNFLIIQKILKK